MTALRLTDRDVRVLTFVASHRMVPRGLLAYVLGTPATDKVIDTWVSRMASHHYIQRHTLEGDRWIETTHRGAQVAGLTPGRPVVNRRHHTGILLTRLWLELLDPEGQWVQGHKLIENWQRDQDRPVDGAWWSHETMMAVEVELTRKTRGRWTYHSIMERMPSTVDGVLWMTRGQDQAWLASQLAGVRLPYMVLTLPTVETLDGLLG